MEVANWKSKVPGLKTNDVIAACIKAALREQGNVLDPNIVAQCIDDLQADIDTLGQRYAVLFSGFELILDAWDSRQHNDAPGGFNKWFEAHLRYAKGSPDCKRTPPAEREG